MVILIIEQTKFTTKSYFRDEACKVKPNKGWSELKFENKD